MQSQLQRNSATSSVKQRRLIRDLANLCRDSEAQIVLTTHSPYVLSELPAEARIYIMDGAAGKQIIKGVSPEFAMTKMDEAHIRKPTSIRKMKDRQTYSKKLSFHKILRLYCGSSLFLLELHPLGDRWGK